MGYVCQKSTPCILVSYRRESGIGANRTSSQVDFFLQCKLRKDMFDVQLNHDDVASSTVVRSKGVKFVSASCTIFI